MDEIHQNNELGLENEPRFESDEDFLIYLMRQGYDDESRVALAVIRRRLISEISELTGRNQIPPTGSKLKLAVGSGLNDNPQIHDDVLLPAWKEFAKALALVPVRPKGYIYLQFSRLQLSQVVSDALLASFKTLPLESLALIGNDIGLRRFKFVTDVLKNNSSLENLIIGDDRIRSAHDAICLMKAVTEHPNVDTLVLDNCGIGQNNDIMEAVMSASSNLRAVSLSGNAIGSYGAGVIAACLARNPILEELELSSNNLDNKDSAKIALSLKSNSILQYLKVDGNRFTRDGIEAFIGAVRGKCLNECSRSNHTCEIDVGEAYGAIGSLLSRMNGLSDPMLNKKHKLMAIAGLGPNSEINFHLINHIPFELTPKVLDFLQGEGLLNPSNYNRLCRLFRVIREWSTSLLCTSRVYHQKRRSERIRENRVKKLKVT